MRYTPVLFILLFISACTSNSDPSPSVDGTRIVPIGVTQVNPTQSDVQTVDNVPVIMPSQLAVECDNAPVIRMTVQQPGRVTDDNNDTLNLRNGPGVSFDILEALDPGDEFMVIGGPTCAGGFAWFRIRHNNNIGWVAEGDSESYYIEPYLSG